MKRDFFYFIISAITLFVITACNKEWTEEQYGQYISFKAPLNNEGVNNIYVRYKSDQPTVFRQALIVSGSTTNMDNFDVTVGLDPDTLDILNFERFQRRTDFYYRLLDDSFYKFSPRVTFKSGENTALLDIQFELKNIDMVDKWILPLTITGLDNSYKPNMRKHYRKALLRINPFNDYSGTYSGTALKTTMDGYENETPIVKSQVKSYVVDENTIFFYAGNIDEERQDRKNYKIYAHFSPTGGVTFSSDNPLIKFAVNKDASYTINEQMDAVRPYLLHRYITINNIDYEFTDYTMVPNFNIKYKVFGSLTLERQLNKQIPDEDQSIEWN